MTIARITVEDGPLTEYPLAEKVRGGWQNGVTFYPDEKVTSVAELVVSRRNDTSVTQYLDDLPTHIKYVPVSHIRSRLAAHDAQVRAEALREAADDFAVVMHPYEGGVTEWLRDRADRIAGTVGGADAGEPTCADHHPVQHRDARPPWCNRCGLTSDFQKPTGRLDRTNQQDRSTK